MSTRHATGQMYRALFLLRAEGRKQLEAGVTPEYVRVFNTKVCAYLWYGVIDVPRLKQVAPEVVLQEGLDRLTVIIDDLLSHLADFNRREARRSLNSASRHRLIKGVLLGMPRPTQEDMVVDPIELTGMTALVFHRGERVYLDAVELAAQIQDDLNEYRAILSLGKNYSYEYLRWARGMWDEIDRIYRMTHGQEAPHYHALNAAVTKLAMKRPLEPAATMSIPQYARLGYPEPDSFKAVTLWDEGSYTVWDPVDYPRRIPIDSIVGKYRKAMMRPITVEGYEALVSMWLDTVAFSFDCRRHIQDSLRLYRTPGFDEAPFDDWRVFDAVNRADPYAATFDQHSLDALVYPLFRALLQRADQMADAICDYLYQVRKPVA